MVNCVCVFVFVLVFVIVLVFVLVLVLVLVSVLVLLCLCLCFCACVCACVAASACDSSQTNRGQFSDGTRTGAWAATAFHLSETRPRILHTTIGIASKYMSLTSRDAADDAPHVERGVDREEVLLHYPFHVFIRQGMAHVLESLDRRAQLCVRLVAGDALLLLSKR